MKIGITGATGQLGQLVVSKLKEKTDASNLVALVRNPSKAESLGIEARQADYNQPETLEKALEGIDTLLLISSNEIGKRDVQHKNAIEAAKKAGVNRIVYTSVVHADTSSLSLAKEHFATEAAIKASGIPYTILRNGWYIENHTAGLTGAVAAGALIGSSGEGKISGATREDYAEAAAAVLTSGNHDGKIYELAGDNAYTAADIAAEVSLQTGKTIGYQNLSQHAYTSALSGFGLPPEIAGFVAQLDAEVSDNAVYDDSRQLSTLIGRPTTPLSTAVADALKGHA